jgi:hypothetical protein
MKYKKLIVLCFILIVTVVFNVEVPEYSGSHPELFVNLQQSAKQLPSAQTSVSRLNGIASKTETTNFNTIEFNEHHTKKDTVTVSTESVQRSTEDVYNGLAAIPEHLEYSRYLKEPFSDYDQVELDRLNKEFVEMDGVYIMTSEPFGVEGRTILISDSPIQKTGYYYAENGFQLRRYCASGGLYASPNSKSTKIDDEGNAHTFFCFCESNCEVVQYNDL